MAEYKYPYIPKDYYPAVIYACKLIRKYGTFNVACQTAADEYGVDLEEVKKHVRKRQGAGQKGKTRKYKHFLFIGWTDEWKYEGFGDLNCLFSQCDPERWKEQREAVWVYAKATNIENAKRKTRNDKMYSDGLIRGDVMKIWKHWEFDSEHEAMEFFKENKDKLKEEMRCLND